LTHVFFLLFFLKFNVFFFNFIFQHYTSWELDFVKSFHFFSCRVILFSWLVKQVQLIYSGWLESLFLFFFYFFSSNICCLEFGLYDFFLFSFYGVIAVSWLESWILHFIKGCPSQFIMLSSQYCFFFFKRCRIICHCHGI
jgi:hypothetical protein